jgi:peptidoglycan/xylan/chitin deacetylase (PgdA/CDA1 family)
MVGSRSAGIGVRSWTAARLGIVSLRIVCLGIVCLGIVCLGILACAVPDAAFAADCPGHPDALGTSRTLVVDPREHPRIGAMQYPETLPLADHEVVLTFDDGPVPRYSNQVLQILADQCVKATFFTIGHQAEASPEGVRKLIAAGHTVGTHSQNHPLTFQKMSADQARQEIDAGIASTTAALADPAQLAPFFRIPGLLRAAPVEEYAASRGIQVWSADFLADDWRHIPASRVYDFAIKRLEARGKGILLLHDIHARTVAALPRILQEMKARGYRIVHVVPATPQQPATPTGPEQWLTHPSPEAVAELYWPKIPAFVFAEAPTLPAPALADFESPDGALLLSPEPFDRAKLRGVPMPREAPWPRLASLAPQPAAATLPAPSANLFTLSEALIAPPKPLPRPPQHAEQSLPAAPAAEADTKPAAKEATARTAQAHLRTGQVRTGHGARRPAQIGHHARRSVRVASLKKR